MSRPVTSLPARAAAVIEGLRRIDAALGSALRGAAREPGAPLHGPARLWRRIRFPKRVRAETWQILADAMAGGSDAGRMIEALAEGYRLSGQGAVADVLLEIRVGIGEARLSERMEPYVGTAERLVFEGFGAHDPARICASAARVLRMELAFRKAVGAAVALPAVLLAGLLGLFYFFGLQLLPALEELVDFDLLPGFPGAVVGLALGFAERPLVPAFAVAGVVAAVALLMRYWTGFGRRVADRFPPFSMQRLQAGAGFLFAVTEYGRSGQAVTTRVLERMAAEAPPYAASRIRALAAEFVPAGSNLGAAALRAGQGFPAVELMAVLRALWNEPDGIQRCGGFIERWMERVETTVRARMAVLNGVLLTAVAVALLALMSIALPIVDQISRGTL